MSCALDQMVKLYDINNDEKFAKNRINQVFFLLIDKINIFLRYAI